MSESKHDSSPSPSETERSSSLWPFGFLLSVLAPVVVAVVVLFQLDPFEAVSYPTQEFSRDTVHVPTNNGRLLRDSEKIGVGQVSGPEDFAYDPTSNLIYTGCVDGWIKRVTVADSVVEDWVNTGGRPLGLVVGHNKEVIVADADKGLLNLSRSGAIELLTNEAEGVGFRLTDGVDIAKDGTVYFTDASYKYGLKDHVLDLLEGRAYGRLMSYDPSTKHTTVLLKHLYFANGVAVSHDHTFVIVCETPMRRCKKYYIEGNKKGSVDIFIDNLPGMPDNIRYDGEGSYWIALPSELTLWWDLLLRYPFLRKIAAVVMKYVGSPSMEKNAGILEVDLEGKPVAYYHDPEVSLITGGIRVGDSLYCGSLVASHILRLNLTRHPAT